MKNVKITTKLIAYFVIIGLSIILTIGILSYYQAKAAILERTEAQLVSIRDIKKAELETFIEDVYKDMDILSKSRDVIDMYAKLKTYHDELDVNKIDKFPTETEAYKRIYSEYNENLRNYTEIYGYYDLFIICKKHGHVMFTAAREADLGTNLQYGKYKDGPLSHLWRHVVESEHIQIEDFEPYAASQGAQAMFIGAPIMSQGKLLGVVILQLSDAPINRIVNQRSGMGNTGELYVVGQWEKDVSSLRSNRIIKKGEIGDPKSDAIIDKCLLGNTGFEIKTGSTGAKEYVSYAPLDLEGLKWAVFSTISEDEVMKPVRRLGFAVFLIGIGIIIVLVIFAYFLAKSIAVPLQKGMAFAEEIAAGNLQATIDIDQEDEIGVLANSMRAMVDKLIGVVITVTETANNVAVAGGELNLSAQQMSASSQMVSQGASEQAASAEEVSSSIEEMSANIQQNTDNSQQTEKIAFKAAKGIAESNKHVDATVTAMREIVEKISFITNIAEKTDLLAINAAIEAARAGEHGKGFAIVAAEVRTLAIHSNKSASEIDIITKESRKIAEKSSELLNSIVPDIEKTSQLIQEISAANSEQNSGANQINTAVQQLNLITQQNAGASEEMAANAEAVSAKSEELTRQAEHLKKAISFFSFSNQTVEAEPIHKKLQHTEQATALDTEKKQMQKENDSGVIIEMGSDGTNDLKFEKY